MAASGALAGLAGVGEVAGVIHRSSRACPRDTGSRPSSSPVSRDSIPGRSSSWHVLFAALLNGGFVIQTTGVPGAIAHMIFQPYLFSCWRARPCSFAVGAAGPGRDAGGASRLLVTLEVLG